MKNIIDLLKGKCKENREIILKLEKVYKHDIYTLTEEGFLNGDLWYTYKENIYYDSIEDIINLYEKKIWISCCNKRQQRNICRKFA